MESKEVSKLRQRYDSYCQIAHCRSCYMKPVAAGYNERSPEGKCDHMRASEGFILECEKAEKEHNDDIQIRKTREREMAWEYRSRTIYF